MGWKSLCLALCLPLPLQHEVEAQSTPGARELATETIAAKAIPATVTIITFDDQGDTTGIGSGFVTHSNGVIITNAHVMAGVSTAEVIMTTGERYDRVEALDVDVASDIAILKIPGYDLPTLRTSPTLPPIGARLVVVGNPLGLSHTVTEGIVSGVRLIGGRQVLQMSAPISSGSSGGPVLNSRGEAVAVATAYLRGGQNLNFAVPVRYAIGLVDPGARPKELAEVFGGMTSNDASSLRSSEVDQSHTTRPAAVTGRPNPASTPRLSVVGVYGVQEEVWVTEQGRSADEPVQRAGVLIWGTRDNGFYVSASRETSGARPHVYPVRSLTTTPDGRLAAEFGSLTWTGYQTADGIYLETATSPGAEKEGFTFRLRGETMNIPLSSSSGLYSLSSRTAFKANGERGGYTDWTGEAAVVTTNDSVYVDMWLQNDSGGSTSAIMTGPMGGDGNFSLTSSHGKSLTGRLAAGRLVAEWVDVREGGHSFEGLLEGRHR